MSHTLSLNWGGDYQERYLPSPYIARPVQPSTRNPNQTGPWLVLHRVTHIVACTHQTERGAQMCARGERCTKGRTHTHHRDAE
jgi:hypothetical protein